MGSCNKAFMLQACCTCYGTRPNIEPIPLHQL